MPEVVEVCFTSIYLDHKLMNKSIEKIVVLSGRYSGSDPKRQMEGLNLTIGKKFNIKKVNSKGKFMWFELESGDNNYYILNTFGLEGKWGFILEKHSRIELTIKADDKIHKLYFTDSRNFGTLQITDKKKDLDAKLNKLGPDLLKTHFSENDFHNRVKEYVGKSKVRYDKEIVKVLMEQHLKKGIGSGIGNYLSVEILYHAKISPYTKIGKIKDNKDLSNRLAKSIKYIIKLSFMTADVGYMDHLDNNMDKFVKKIRKEIKNDSTSQYNYHPDIDIKNDKFSFKVYRQKEDPYGNKVVGDIIITSPQRTTYWVPSIQKSS